VADTREPYIIERRNGENVALISEAELSSLLETAHLLRSPRNAQRLASAEKFEAEAGPGIWKVISGEPVADLNYLMITAATPVAIESFQRHVADLDRRELPFACMVGSEVADALKPVCAGAGLVHATDWPLMVCPASAVQAHVKEGVSVHRVETEQDATDSARLLSEAFHMPLDSVRRVVPLAMAQLPGIEVQLARVGGRASSSVTVTRHDQVVGIWGMGTPPEEQGKGLGKVLLSQVMEEHRRRGAEAPRRRGLLTGRHPGRPAALREARLPHGGQRAGLGSGRDAPGLRQFSAASN